jgi:hypothetical protein
MKGHAKTEGSQEKTRAVGSSKANPVSDRLVRAHQLPVYNGVFPVYEPGEFQPSLNQSLLQQPRMDTDKHSAAQVANKTFNIQHSTSNNSGVAVALCHHSPKSLQNVTKLGDSTTDIFFRQFLRLQSV